jgi:hypothetical protein
MTPSPSATAILTDLAALGIVLKRDRDGLRYRPKSKMTPAILERMKSHKAELVALLDTHNAVAELRRSVADLFHDPAWHSAWMFRFRYSRCGANFDSLQRVLNMVIDLAAKHHRHDWPAFMSTCNYLRHLASGAAWDHDIAEPVIVPRTVCRYFHHDRRWRSVHGAFLCGICAPPCRPDLVQEWLPPKELTTDPFIIE